MRRGVHELAVPYVDAAPEQLRWATGLPLQDALRAADIELGGARMQLRLLGMSHQVTLSRQSKTFFTETVACAGTGQPLPHHWSDDAYQFSCSVVRYAESDFVEAVNAITDRVDSEQNVLAGAFPGSPLAVTAIQAVGNEPNTATWQTWHSYPQSATIVHTQSTYRLAAQ